MNVLDQAHDTTYLRALSPDETQLAEASVGGGVRITRFPTGEVTQQIGAPEMAHAHDVLALAWSPNGKYLATGGLDSLVKVWELTTGACIQAYSGHTMPVLDIAWNTMGTLLASGGGDEVVQVWNPSTGETCYTYRAHRATINRITWEFGGEVLATTDSGITTLYWDVVSGRADTSTARRYRFESHPWTRSAFVGSRWILRAEVDRYDFFLAPEGMTGVVRWMEAGVVDPMIALKMDEPLRPDNLDVQQSLDEDYDNCIEWSLYYASEEDGVPLSVPVWKAFIADCQRLW